ncbi:MAG: TCR/Tet family MFS transporter [Verrucomicrobiales bacterium]|nr:TCR/Tet family MFS transporter [Verrucomicrobiales bacterium]
MPARKPAVVFIFITLVLDVLGIGLIVPILPKLIEEFEGGSVERAAQVYGLLTAVYALAQFVFAPVLGSLSDRWGRRPVILLSLFGSGVDYLFLAMAPSLPWFFVGRLISGITGANFSAATAYIADVTPPEKRAASFGLVGAAFGLGFILGPAIGGMLGHYGLRVPFYAAAGLTLVNWLYGAWVLPESLKVENRRPFSWRRANPLGALMALKRYPMVFRLAGVWFLLSLAHQVYPATWVLYATYRFDWTVRETGLSLALVGVTSALVQGGLTRVIIPRMGERRAVVFGIAVGVVEHVLFGSVTVGWMIYLIILGGCLAGLATPAAQGLISNTVRADEQGAVQGSLNSLVSIAGVIGPLVMSSLFGYFISDRAPVHLPGVAFYLAALLDAVALIWVIRAFKKTPEGAG